MKKAPQLPLCSAMLWVAPRHSAVTLSILLALIVLNMRLFGISPKGFLPEHDTGRPMGRTRVQQSASFPTMMDKTTDLVKMVASDPHVSKVVALTRGQSVTHADRSRVLIRTAKPGLGSSGFLGAPMLATFRKIPGFLDVNTDQQNKGLEAWLTR